MNFYHSSVIVIINATTRQCHNICSVVVTFIFDFEYDKNLVVPITRTRTRSQI